MSDHFKFVPWPKTPRWSNETITVTEKIDGTNAQINITYCGKGVNWNGEVEPLAVRTLENGDQQILQAGSRNRWLSVQDDNFGFAKWCVENQTGLFNTFQHGRIYGEWWGQGIQRGYDCSRKFFSMFDTRFPIERCSSVEGLTAVPVLYTGKYSDEAIKDLANDLIKNGSKASPGFMKVEGLCICMHSTDRVYKVIIDK